MEAHTLISAASLLILLPTEVDLVRSDEESDLGFCTTGGLLHKTASILMISHADLWFYPRVVISPMRDPIADLLGYGEKLVSRWAGAEERSPGPAIAPGHLRRPATTGRS